MAFRASVIASFGEDFESQCAGDRRRLDQLHRNGVAEPIRLAGMVADQGMARLIVTVVVVANRARRTEAVGSGLRQFDEQSRAGVSADAALERRTNAIGEEIRDQ